MAGRSADKNLAFWETFKSTLPKELLNLSWIYKTSSKSILYCTSSVPGIRFNWRIANHHTRVSVSTQSLKSSRRLLDYRNQIESTIEFPLIWKEKPEGILIYRDLPLGREDTDKVDELREAMIQKMISIRIAFEDVFKSWHIK